jgi:hypothetical protein
LLRSALQLDETRFAAHASFYHFDLMLDLQ